MKDADARTLLRDLFDAALAAARPATCLAPYIAKLQPPQGKTIVIGAGKASAAMARAVEDQWPHPLEGLVVTRYGYGEACKRIEIVEAAHPVPDEKGRAAAGRILERVKGLSADDLVLCLISGGASALLALPAPGLTLADKQEVNRALLKSGANIGEMNTVRKHLSAIKGGRLAIAAQPARVLSLADLRRAQRRSRCDRLGPDRGRPHDLRRCAGGARQVPDRPARRRTRPPRGGRHGQDRRDAQARRPAPQARRDDHRGDAQAIARGSGGGRPLRGCVVVMLGDNLEGEARELGAAHARRALELVPRATKPTVILSGGETTVTVRGKGRGGRNVEYLLGKAIEAAGAPQIWGLAADTDGVDGAEEIAGAIFTPDSLTRAIAKGRDPKAMLEDNDGHSFFELLGDSLITGPTRTNVNDFRATLIVPKP